MKTGAVIVADGMSSYMNDFRPMLKIGGTTIIKQIITTLKQAGVDSIVVMTGNKADQLEEHISNMGVICVRNERFSETQMLDSARIGLEYLQYECERIFFTTADIPLFSGKSVCKLLDSSAEIACPSYKGTEGNLLLISSELIPMLLSYTGTDGLRGAIEFNRRKIMQVPIDDEVILLAVDTPHDYESILSQYQEMNKAQTLHFTMKLRLAKEKIFFGPGVVEFLILVDQTGSMQTACSCMQMSYSKGWKMVNLVEEQLGFPILARRAGGSGGGSSQLTEQGLEFTKRFIDFQNEATAVVGALFNKYFADNEE